MRFYKRSKFKIVCLNVAIGAVLLIGIPALERATNRTVDYSLPAAVPFMSLTVFDVGQGDAILSQEGDRQILFDGGPDKTILDKLGEVMPPGDRTIDLVVLTHPHADHLTGLLSVLDRYEVGRILETDLMNDTAAYRAWQEKIASRGIHTDNPRTMRTERVADMVFDILSSSSDATENLNDASIVGMLSFGSRHFLLMGDATMNVENSLKQISADKLQADVLKVGHHGSRYSISETFLKLVQPSYAFISVGAKNTYGHPAWNVITLLRTLGIKIYRTDRDGDVTALTDGESLQVQADKVP